MTTLTLLSNGHGEDAIGARLLAELAERCPELALQAFPLVGVGRAYEALGVPLLGPRKALPSGGLMLHSVADFVSDLRAGYLPMTLAQLRDLRRLQTDLLLIVGDLYAQLLATAVRCRTRFVLQPLVSSRLADGAVAPPPHRLAMERFTLLERRLLRRAQRVYVRDAETAEALRAFGLQQVAWLGNPMVDAAVGRPIPELMPDPGQGGPARPGRSRPGRSHNAPLLALLPGTRRHAPHALRLMLQALERLPEVEAAVAWAAGALPEVPGWRRLPPPDGAPAGTVALLEHATRARSGVLVLRGRFADLLASAEVALGTAGTANEQAVAMGLPVVSFAVPPHYSPAFLANQQRLLGEALTVVPAEPQQVAAAVRELLGDAERRGRLARLGRERMGPPGGSCAIVDDLLAQGRALGLLSCPSGAAGTAGDAAGCDRGAAAPVQKPY